MRAVSTSILGILLSLAGNVLHGGEGSDHQDMADVSHLLSAIQKGSLQFTMEHLDQPGGVMQKTRLQEVRVGKNTLSVAHGAYRIDFSLQPRTRYLVLRIKEVVEPEPGTLMKLAARVERGSPLVLTRLDYMSVPSRDGHAMSWPWIWARDTPNPLGAFAIQTPQNDKDHDENLLRMWVHDGLPHPPGAWTMERARTWLKNWQKRFEDQSCLVVGAQNRHELDRLTTWAAKNGMKRIYMHTDTWRGEYWPVRHSYLRINPKVFPRGEHDLTEYTSALRKKGMSIAVHSTCMSVAREDPDYVKPGLDPRLSRWVRGTLSRDVGPTDTTLHFRPETGSRYPRMVRHEWAGPDTMRTWMNLRLFLVDGELLEAGSVNHTGKDIWVLKNCRRGVWGKAAAAHRAGAPCEGMTRSYGQVFVPDADGSLFPEMIRRWADFCTRNKVDHLECDALESHQDKPWGAGKFSWLLSSCLTLPSTSNTSGGRPLEFQVEYWFRSSRRAASNHAVGGVAGGASLPLFLHSDIRMATGPYEILFKPAEMLGHGGNSFNISYPWPMFGVTPEILEKHGMVPKVEQMIRNWRTALPRMDENCRKQIASAYGRFRSPIGAARNQAGTDVLFRPELMNGKIGIVPLRLVGRADGELNWGFGQEFGPIVPRQYVRIGESLRLSHSGQPQEPEFVIRLMGDMALVGEPLEKDRNPGGQNDAMLDAYATGTHAEQGGTNVQDPEAVVKPGLRKGGSSAREHAPDDRHTLMPGKSTIEAVSSHELRVDDRTLLLSCRNDSPSTAVHLDERPAWATKHAMHASRGLSCTVVGDNSGALLVITLEGRGKRDYLVPIDFTGERELRIPSGEVAWGDPRWGWRHHAARFDYSSIRKVRLGFGTVPPKTHAKARVKNIRALRQVPCELENLTISLGSDRHLRIPGTLTSGHYLWYRGGASVGLYDLNWNKVADLPVSRKNFTLPKGPFSMLMSTTPQERHPWLEVQFFSKDDVISPGLSPLDFATGEIDET